MPQNTREYREFNTRISRWKVQLANCRNNRYHGLMVDLKIYFKGMEDGSCFMFEVTSEDEKKVLFDLMELIDIEDVEDLKGAKVKLLVTDETVVGITKGNSVSWFSSPHLEAYETPFQKQVYYSIEELQQKTDYLYENQLI